PDMRSTTAERVTVQEAKASEPEGSESARVSGSVRAQVALRRRRRVPKNRRRHRRLVRRTTRQRTMEQCGGTSTLGTFVGASRRLARTLQQAGRYTPQARAATPHLAKAHGN